MSVFEFVLSLLIFFGIVGLFALIISTYWDG